MKKGNNKITELRTILQRESQLNLQDHYPPSVQSFLKLYHWVHKQPIYGLFLFEGPKNIKKKKTTTNLQKY